MINYFGDKYQHSGGNIVKDKYQLSWTIIFYV